MKARAVANIEPMRPIPVGAGRSSGRQPGNKPPSFERSVWAAPVWRPLLREFLRRRVAFSLVTFFWRSKRKTPAAARKAADKKHPRSGYTRQKQGWPQSHHGMRPTFGI
ncbi:hypothetical protein [Vogesella indigofera]|uniref:hypothetical protein n=1 Tax=Vogesella indigofera TaxID=45465 RepID=UPI00234ED18B|nr:hypothetical protein [Vogesella indigofera]MDC7709171.1 hypothetical protein [Vogesella indigofera]